MSHSWFAASACGRIMLCGGSALIDTSDLPPRPKPAADLGTYLHHCCEQALRSGGEIESSLDGEQRDSVQAYVDYVRGHEGWIKLYEYQSLMMNQCGGTSDCVMISRDGKTLKIVDYKSGRWFVDPAENTQLLIYARGVLDSLDFLCDAVEDVVLAIVQPAVDNYGEWELSRTDLIYRTDKIKERIAEIMEGDAEYEPSDEACQWCPGKDVCPARTEFAQHAARLDFEDRDWNEDEEDEWMTAKQILDKNPEDLTWSEKMVVAELAASWASSITNTVKDMVLADPDSVPGFKAVEGRRVRAWKDKRAIANAKKYMYKHGFTDEDLHTEPAVRSPSQFEGLFKGKGSGELKKPISKYTIHNDGPPTVVPDSDPRQPLDRAAMAARDFADREEDE